MLDPGVLRSLTFCGPPSGRTSKQETSLSPKIGTNLVVFLSYAVIYDAATGGVFRIFSITP